MKMDVNVKFDIGETCYTVKEVAKSCVCEMCNGEGELVLFDTVKKYPYRIPCFKCNGTGLIQSNKEKMFVVIQEPVTVTGIKINIKENKEYGCKYVLKSKQGNRYSKNGEKLFSSIEEAQKWCDKMNKPKKTVKLSDIEIPSYFSKSIPSPNKIKDKIAYYNKHKKFDSKIVINENNTLKDGYITYLLAKMYGKETIECYVE